MPPCPAAAIPAAPLAPLGRHPPPTRAAHRSSIPFCRPRPLARPMGRPSVASDPPDALTFEEAFDAMKASEYALQKSLVDHVLTESYALAEDAKRRLESVIPDNCPPDVAEALEIGRGMFPGQTFRHRRYRYRGVIWKADAACKATESWIQAMGVRGLGRGAGQPFYQCLVDERDRPGGQTTYVAEENVELSVEAFPVRHGLVGAFFVEVPALRCYVGTEELERALAGAGS
eukprot:evm.model.scf_878EXC.8 EVM.evm.TU.scf_878EXC.8   scf_878EXC:48023-48715(+)